MLSFVPSGSCVKSSPVEREHIEGQVSGNVAPLHHVSMVRIVFMAMQLEGTLSSTIGRRRTRKKHHQTNANMSVRVAPCGTTTMVRSSAVLLGMVSMAVQAVPDRLLFPLPFLKYLHFVQPGNGPPFSILDRIF
jgi:hypothetical protein